MKGKLISIEKENGPFGMVFTRVMQMVPDRDRNDTSLQRMIAFRLKNDGEGATRRFLISRIREMIQCAYTGRLYDFIKDDKKRERCGIPPTTDPPEIA